MHKLMSSLLILSSIFLTSSVFGDVNILIIGSEYDSSKVFWTEKSRAFKAAKIRAELENILNGAGVGTANVVYEDRYKFDNGYETFNFASWFHWPYPAGSEIERWQKLRGEGGTQWDYVILIGDSFTIEQMPGLYTHGVAKVAEEVAKGANGAETVLLMPWPSAVSDSTVAHYKEVVYRVGRSGGFKVAPAGLAWQAAGSPADGYTDTDKGAYLAAATLYSRLWNKSAKESSYTFDDALADTVHATVTANVGAQQYTGKWSSQSPFKGFNYNNNNFNVRKASGGTSTEDLIMSGSRSAISRAGIRSGDDPNVTFYNGRATGSSTGNKDYRNKGNVISFGHYFPSETTDKDKTLGSIFSRDIALAKSMQSKWHQYRLLPHRLLAGGMLHHDPTVNIYPGGHMYGPRQTAIGTYIVTILSGYCPMNSKPATITNDWMAQKIGYEMAWNVSTLQARAPGFKVKPARTTVGFASPETVTVEFILKPKNDVTVTITSTSPDITMSSQTLTFTPDNHDTPQQVTFLAKPGAAPGAKFNLEFNTSSDDEVCDNLKYIWSYRINQAPTANPKTVSAYTAKETPITLTSSDPNGEARTYFIVDQPQHGTVSLSGTVAVYTSNAGYTGTDSFTFKVNDGVDDSPAAATVDINVIPTTIYDFNLINNGSAELAPIENYDWIEVLGNWGRTASTVDGSYAFRNWSTIANAEMYQDIDVSFYSSAINAGAQSFKFSGTTDSVNDETRVYLEFRNAANQVLDTYETISTRQRAWRSFSVTRVAPANTVKIRVRLRTIRMGGQDNESKFDKLRLVALEPVGNVNTPPGASNGSANTDEDVAVAINLVASDADGDPLTYSFTQPTNGALSGTAPNLTYTPAPGFFGNDSFTFTANDGTVNSNVATVSISVNEVIPPNTAPVANNGSAATNENVATGITLVASDVNGDALTYLVNQPANGTLTGTAPSLTYMPNAGFFGSDSFTFRANDGQANSNIATVNITVTEVNSAPVAVNGSLTTDEDVAKTVSLSASDADSDTLTYTIVAQPVNGTLSGTAPDLTYTPNTGYTGIDFFTFKANDGSEDSNIATVSITVTVPSTVSLVSAVDRLGWFTFDTDTTDTDGNLSLALTGDAQAGVADGKFGGSFQATSLGQSGVIADNDNLNSGGPWSARTTAAWFKLDTISGRQVVMEVGGSTRGFNIYVDNGDLYVGGWDKNLDNDDIDTWNGTWHNLGKVTAGQWYHVAFVLDATVDPTHLSNTAFKAYLNGIEAASGNGMQIHAHSHFGLGSLAGGTLYHDGSVFEKSAFNGKVDDLVIWNRALNAAEIATLADVSISQDVVIVESGSVSVEQPNSSTWFTVNLEYSFIDPVVILGPATIAGGQPVAPRVRNVTANSFQFQIDEWDYLDGYHLKETISWMVVEAGDHTLPDGSRIVAGKTNAGRSFSTVSWDAFTAAPVVFSQVASVNDAKAVTTRQKSVTKTGFQVSLEVEEAVSSHGNETVAWVAISSGTGVLGEVGRTTDSVTHEWSSVSFTDSKATAPLILANMQTTDGPDTATLRIRNKTTSGFEVQVQEETSRDSELAHTTEVVGYFVLTPGQITKEIYPSAESTVLAVKETAESGVETTSELYTGDTGISIGGNGSLSDAEYLQLGQSIDLLVLNEGTFTMTVTAVSGTYTFNLNPEELFGYSIISNTEFDVTYSDSKEIMDLLDILFSDDEILEVTFP